MPSKILFWIQSIPQVWRLYFVCMWHWESRSPLPPFNPPNSHIHFLEYRRQFLENSRLWITHVNIPSFLGKISSFGMGRAGSERELPLIALPNPLAHLTVHAGTCSQYTKNASLHPEGPYHMSEEVDSIRPLTPSIMSAGMGDWALEGMPEASMPEASCSWALCGFSWHIL